jgi:hypothetical protein
MCIGDVRYKTQVETEKIPIFLGKYVNVSPCLM